MICVGGVANSSCPKTGMQFVRGYAQFGALIVFSSPPPRPPPSPLPAPIPPPPSGSNPDREGRAEPPLVGGALVPSSPLLGTFSGTFSRTFCGFSFGRFFGRQSRSGGGSGSGGGRSSAGRGLERGSCQLASLSR